MIHSDQKFERVAPAGAIRQEAVKLMKFVASFGWGGTERQFVNLGLSLDPSRFAVHFGCQRRFGVLLDEINAGGIPVLNYEVPSFRHARALISQVLLARDIRQMGIQIVHSYGFYANVFAIPAAKLAGARVVASIRDMGIYLSPSKKLAQRLVCRFADHILVNAGAIKDWLVSDGYDERRITVIPNGIDLSRFKTPVRSGSLHRELRMPIDTPLIGVVGRVNRNKGIENFLTAAASIVHRFPTARFVVVGESSFLTRGRTIIMEDAYQDELIRLARELGVQDRVIFTGFRADIERLLPELTISVQPSLSEGLSNTLLESMAAGVPVVATRVGGTGEVIRHGENGLLVSPGDPAAIAAAVCQLLGAPDVAAEIGERARRTIVEHYSMTRVVERTSLVYDSLLTSSRRANLRPSLNTN